MADDGANVPELRFPEFEGEWSTETLGSFFTFKNGVNADKAAYGSGYKFINVLDVLADAKITHDRIIGYVDVTKNEFEKNEVKYGDILFQRSSETREEVGQSNVYLDRTHSATFGGFVIRGRPIQEMQPLYFDSLLKTSAVRRDMTSRSGGSTRYNIGQESLSEVSVSISVIQNEQKKIATFLGAVDGKIGQLEKKKALLEDYKKGCMQKLFSRTLRFKGDNGNDFPDWEEKRLGEILKIGSGRDHQNLKSGDIPVYGTGGFMRKVDDYLYEGDSVCIGRKGTIDAPFFVSGKFWTVDTLFYTHSFIGVIPRFVLAIFEQINWQKHNEASGVPSLSKGTIQGLKLQVPQIKEQQKIADFLTAIDDKITLATNQLTQAQTFKKGLLQQMFV